VALYNLFIVIIIITEWVSNLPTVAYIKLDKVKLTKLPLCLAHK